jgi:hypothetical protein
LLGEFRIARTCAIEELFAGTQIDDFERCSEQFLDAIGIDGHGMLPANAFLHKGLDGKSVSNFRQIFVEAGVVVKRRHIHARRRAWKRLYAGNPVVSIRR